GRLPMIRFERQTHLPWWPDPGSCATRGETLGLVPGRWAERSGPRRRGGCDTRRRGDVPQRTVRSPLVVLDAPVLDQHAGLEERGEDLALEQLRAPAPV